MANSRIAELGKETRFKPGNPIHSVKKGDKRGPYFTPLLKKFLNKKISYIDPETQKKIRGKILDAVLWRLILNAVQGENDAIKTIFDRVDGKVTQKLIGEGMASENKIVIIRAEEAKKDGKAFS